MSGKQRVQLAAAFLLHQRPWRESSALLEVFTETHGRIGLVARGVRSARSRQRGDLQLFRPLCVSWQARGELGTLTGAEADGAALHLQGRALYCGFYLNELLMRLLARHDPHPELFGHYRRSLQRLAAGERLEQVLRGFELSLLEEAGYGLQLEADADSGEALCADTLYDYHLESGPVALAGGDDSGFAFRGASLIAMARGELHDDAVLADARRLLRAALALYLGDKPLMSRELFKPLGK